MKRPITTSVAMILLLATTAMANHGSDDPTCGVLTILDEERDFILVTDEEIPMDIRDEPGLIHWTWDAYLCMFPEPVNVPTSSGVFGDNDSDNDDLANVAVPDPSLLMNQLSASERAEFDLMGEFPLFVPLSHPDIEHGISINAAESEESGSFDGGIGIAASPGIGSGPRISGGVIRINILAPYDSTQAPESACHATDATNAEAAMEAQYSVNVVRSCYIYGSSNSNAWNSCNGIPSNTKILPDDQYTGSNEYYSTNTYGCTDDANKLIDRFDYHVKNKVKNSAGVYFMMNEVNEIAMTIVNEATNNGIAWTNGWTSLISEYVSEGANHRHEDAIMVHEWGHQFSAGHYPDNGWKKNVCGSYHYHWWGWHYHGPYESVMNYCHMYWGYTNFDSTNKQIVKDNISDTTASGTKGPPRP